MKGQTGMFDWIPLVEALPIWADAFLAAGVLALASRLSFRRYEAKSYSHVTAGIVGGGPWLSLGIGSGVFSAISVAAGIILLLSLLA